MRGNLNEACRFRQINRRVSDLQGRREFSINPGGCVQHVAYLGQENGIGQWVVLEVLQNANSFDLTSVTTDERFSKLARVGLG